MIPLVAKGSVLTILLVCVIMSCGTDTPLAEYTPSSDQESALKSLLLDAMTDGGRGVALLAPFSNERYFLPWTPIEVSPLGVRAFFSQRGLTVMKSEILWVWLPVATLAILWRMIRRISQ